MSARRIDPTGIDIDFLKSEFNRFRDELSGMKDKLGANASEALDQMGSYLNGAGVTSRVAALEAELEALAGKVKGGSKVAVARLESEVSERPLTSIALAFGVGLLAAQFIRRS
jgi:ElaB/YqjD/DUF883 family membrane-anchored ribosome-binding protein